MRAELRGVGADDPSLIIADAREIGVLLSAEQLAEATSFYGPWAWGPVARGFLFGYQADSFADPETELQTRRERETIETRLLPDEKGELVTLPNSDPDALTSVLASRRSRRSFGAQPVELTSLAKCLHAGFGITGELTTDSGRTLPLTAAPSPGGLNTFDAYVLSRSVSGLDPGTYRYLPQKHAMSREAESRVELDKLLGGQQWAANAACAIVFMADFRRQASKYAFPTTVGAALIEAGARVQLVLLETEEASLSATVVGMTGAGAYDRQQASEAGLQGETSMTVPICAVLLGSRQAG